MSVPHLYVSSHSDLFGIRHIRTLGLNMNDGLGAWPAANRALYHPFENPWRYPIKYLWWMNGTGTGNNMNVGIYTESGSLLIQTGSTARNSSARQQFVAVDYLLMPGRYYYGQVCDSTATNMIYQIGSTLTTITARLCGILQEDIGGMTLPNTMNPAEFTTAVVPINGFTMSEGL
jgi:hypothetical protein